MISKLVVFSALAMGLANADSSSATTTSSSSSSSSSSTSVTSTNPLIPTTVSSSCINALVSINSDSTLSSCTSSIASAVSAFNPSTGSVTSGDVSSTINTLCASGTVTSCSSSNIRTLLSTLESGCSTELESSSPTADENLVRYHYDLLYGLVPFTNAICAIDTTSEKSCLVEIVSGVAPSADGSTSSLANDTTTSNVTSKATSTFDIGKYVDQQVLSASNLYYTVDGNEDTILSEIFSSSSSTSKRDGSSSSSTSYLLSNTPLLNTANLPYLFLSSSFPSSMLCTQCTKTIILQYISFENLHPYYNGISSSPFLSGQTALYSSLSGVCGSAFVTSIEQADGLAASGAFSVKSGMGALTGLMVVMAAFI